ncbi:ABC transporter ATP-binding protein [Streptosporangium carneum]|uniref:ABC transporter ATP-binding protein n=1 Tax=Streptosporangium carneum TaxID=47481 RepID=A0A9W6MD28_9ACTN|nr:ABC transporter ATP-binding protein [Streptosporangium carneum]GLK10089.1 ABC transporter ATP-binding protein [Streptosporangium carneum]
MRVELTGLHLPLGGVAGADLRVEPGEFVGLIGPNGSGKSTLLRSLYRTLRPEAGTVLVGGDDVWRTLSARRSAQRIAVVAQHGGDGFDFTVAELVATGRTPHRGAPAADRRIVAAALERVGMAGKADRVYTTLSGGERQRALLARALAQQGGVLVLDEPTNHLDVHAQFELLDLIRSLRVTALAALHELNLAAAYCDRLYVLDAGRIVAHGAPADVLTPDLLAEVFGVRAHLGVNPLTGRPNLAFAPLGQTPVPLTETGDPR